MSNMRESLSKKKKKKVRGNERKKVVTPGVILSNIIPPNIFLIRCEF